MVAGPVLERLRFTRLPQATNDIAVRVQDADRRDTAAASPFAGALRVTKPQAGRPMAPKYSFCREWQASLRSGGRLLEHRPVVIRRYFDQKRELQAAQFDGLDGLVRRQSHSVFGPRGSPSALRFLARAPAPVDDGELTSRLERRAHRSGESRPIGDAMKGIRHEYEISRVPEPIRQGRRRRPAQSRNWLPRFRSDDDAPHPANQGLGRSQRRDARFWRFAA